MPLDVDRDARLDLEAQRVRNAALMQRCDVLANELWQVRHSLQVLEADHAATRTRLDEALAAATHARATITLMERSLFWRARRVWVRLRALAAPLL